MSARSEVFSSRFYSNNGKKTYFFNVKENRFQDLFLTIVESRKEDNGKFNRTSIQIFGEMLEVFNDKIQDLGKVFSEGSVRESLDALKIENSKRYYEFKVFVRNDAHFDLTIFEKKVSEEPTHRFDSIRVNGEDYEFFLKYFALAYDYINGQDAVL